MPSQSLEIYQPDAQVGELKLWRPPAQVLVEAQQAASELQRIISTKAKKVVFNGEQYLEYEDWQTLSQFFGYVPKVESTEFVNFGDVQGFKASAILLNEHTGMIVSRAESMCLNDEENWGPRPKYEWRDVLNPEGAKVWDEAKKKYKGERVQVGTVPTPLFQLLSMAQTRACAKVCRNKLAWVAVLAGYKPTPVEEMDESVPAIENGAEPLPTEIKKKPVTEQATAEAAPTKQQKPSPAKPIQSPQAPTVRVISEAQSRRFYAIYMQNGRSQAEVSEFLQSVCGCTDSRQIPVDKYERACKWAETGEDF